MATYNQDKNEKAIPVEESHDCHNYNDTGYYINGKLVAYPGLDGMLYSVKETKE